MMLFSALLMLSFLFLSLMRLMVEMEPVLLLSNSSALSSSSASCDSSFSFNSVFPSSSAFKMKWLEI